MRDGPPPHPIFFDKALQRALAFAERHLAELGGQPVLVRDLHGRVRIAIDDRPLASALAPARLDALAAELHAALGAYSPGETREDVFIFGHQLIAPDELFQAPDAQPLPDAPAIRLLERQLTGQDWLRPPFDEQPRAARATLYGIKGGVGRSTALAVWALRLAQEGKRVLVVDLDLESPGVSAMLLPPEQLPDFGLVDYFVEDEVGQGAEIVPRIYRPSPLGQEARGEVLVAPAYGSPTGDYLAKLARVYLGKPGSAEGFAERLCELVRRLEDEVEPDVVLLDSRAGLHDIAAVAVTRLQALALLFAVNTTQTLEAYRLLFEGFRRRPALLARFRDNLQAVAALVPETGRERYLEELQTRIYQLFAGHIYEREEVPGEDVFNYSLTEEDAPHQPIPIYWYRWFQDFDPSGWSGLVHAAETQAAFGPFVERATRLLLP